SLDGQTRPLAAPFFVLATQNPYEFEGTYPLPESQLDRSLMRLRIGYPSRQDEKRILTYRGPDDKVTRWQGDKVTEGSQPPVTLPPPHPVPLSPCPLTPGEACDRLQPVLSAAEVTSLQTAARAVRVDESLSDYVLDLTGATRDHPDVHLGASTRAALALY